jgi:hypothetical protein
MPAVINETEARRNTLSSFIEFHRQSTERPLRAVRFEPNGTSPTAGSAIDMFSEADVKCNRKNGSWTCVIYHLHVSKTQKGMPHVFKYTVEDDPARARFECKPITQPITSK